MISEEILEIHKEDLFHLVLAMMNYLMEQGKSDLYVSMAVLSLFTKNKYPSRLAKEFGDFMIEVTEDETESRKAESKLS